MVHICTIFALAVWKGLKAMSHLTKPQKVLTIYGHMTSNDI